MNARHPFPQPPPYRAPGIDPAAPSAQPPPAGMESPRHRHRQRDFGIGYGNSSGYGSERHYVDGHVDPIFRLV